MQSLNVLGYDAYNTIKKIQGHFFLSNKLVLHVGTKMFV